MEAKAEAVVTRPSAWRSVWAIARATLLEAMRARVFYVLILFGIAMIGFSRAFTWLSPGEESKVILDMGISTITLIGVIVAIFFGAGLIPSDVENRTILTVLSKPVTRGQYVVGKFLGMALILLACILPMAVFYWLAAKFYVNFWEWDLVKAIVLIYFQLLTLASVVIAVSTVASFIVNVVFGFTVYILGNLVSYILHLMKRVESEVLRFMLAVLYYLLPQLERFSPGEGVFEYQTIPLKDMLVTIGIYAILYILAMLVLSWFLFGEREV